MFDNLSYEDYTSLCRVIGKMFRDGDLMITECDTCDGNGFCENENGRSSCANCNGTGFTVEKSY